MTPEGRNYLCWCAHPVSGPLAAAKFAERAWWSAFTRALGRRVSFEPREVRSARRRLEASAPDGPVTAPDPGPLPRRPLTLARGSVVISDESRWLEDFADIEETVALHRWGWLLRGLTDDATRITRQEGLALMRSWIRTCAPRGLFAVDAYTTAERIANGGLFLLLTGGDVPADVAAAFRDMARQVAGHLEYYPSGFTGNHALNNARGLLFAGLLADQPAAVDLAAAIIRERLPRLETADGFMREGSSHYHFLFTRWVLEMHWLARRLGHPELEALISPHAKRLVSRCWFFLVRGPGAGTWTIPLIGDVSPDCPPEWLLSLPWASLACAVFRPEELPPPPRARGWGDLFGLEAGAQSSPATRTECFPASGLGRIDHEGWTLFARAETISGSLEATHRHHDTASFVLYREGVPILVDPGRLDYTAEPTGRYGRTAAAHNTVMVSGLGPSADGPTWLAGDYAGVRAGIRCKHDGSDAVVTIEHDGFRRLAGGAVRHVRVIRLNAARVTIDDHLAGSGERPIAMRFHFAPGLELELAGGGTWRVGAPELSFVADERLKAQSVVRTDARAGGLYFPRYGEEVPTSTLESSGTVRLPLEIHHEMRTGAASPAPSGPRREPDSEPA